MPKKKKKKKKIKKATSSSFGELYVDTIKNRDTSKKQKKFEKILSSEKIPFLSKTQWAKMFEEDSGMGLENFDKTFLVNVFDEARKVKSYKQLEHFIERFIPSMDAADVALAAAWYAKDNWNVIKIMKDPDCQGAIMELLEHVDKHTAKKTYASIELITFCSHTGYKMPKTIKTFQEQITMFKDHFGLKRKKNKLGAIK